MDQMLEATQQAAWAAQSAAQAAWWAVFVNAGVVVVAVGTAVAQEWLFRKRVAKEAKAVRKGAVDTVREGWMAIETAREGFGPKEKFNANTLAKAERRVALARRMIELYVAREVDIQIAQGLLMLDDDLAEAGRLLSAASNPRNPWDWNRDIHYDGLNKLANSAQRIFMSIP